MERIDLEVKFQAAGEGLVAGYASIFGGEPDSYGDVIAPGAYAASLASHKASGTMPLMLWQHDTREPVGRWLDLKEDGHGLHVTGQLILETTRGREAYALLKGQALNGLSIGFRTKGSKRLPGGGRLLTEIELIEVSLVSVPAAPKARLTSVKTADPGTSQRSQTMAEDLTAGGQPEHYDVDLEARTAALEDTVTELKTHLASVEASVGNVEKAAGRIEQKLARPGLITRKDETVDDTQKKAFRSYVRHGEVAGPELKALSLASNGGGYLAPDEFVQEVLKNLVQFSPVRQVARVMNIGASEARMPKRTGTLTAAWVAETASRSSTQPTYGEVTLTPHEAACYVDVSNQLLEDNTYNLVGELSMDIAEEFGRLEGAAFINGDGSGKPTGILQDGTITTVAAGSTTAITSDKLIDLFHSLPGFYAANGVWGMNRTTIGAVRKLKTSDGDYIWRDSIAEGNPATILGRPVVEMPDMPDIAAAAEPILFGDLRQGYRIVDRVSLSVMRDPYSVATTGQTRFHARRRVGGQVVKPEAIRLLTMAV